MIVRNGSVSLSYVDGFQISSLLLTCWAMLLCAWSDALSQLKANDLREWLVDFVFNASGVGQYIAVDHPTTLVT